MKVIAIIDFNDLQEDCKRKKGEQFEVTEERHKSLLGTPWGDLVCEVKENVDESDENVDEAPAEDETPAKGKKKKKAE